MAEEQKEETKKEDVKKKKHTLRNIIIILLVIILLFVGTYILHTQELLPDAIDNMLEAMFEPLDDLFGIENDEDEDNEKDKKEDISMQPDQTTIIATLDEKYDGKEVEIIDVYNENTSLFATYPEEIRNSVAILIVDGKKGLVSSETGEVVVEPKYELLYSDMIEDKSDEYIIGAYYRKDDKDKINLKNFKVSKYEVEFGHGGGGLSYYDPKKDKVYYWEYEPSEIKTGDKSHSERLTEGTGGTLEICREFEEDGEFSEVEDNPLKGYYDTTTGKIEIKPEYEKVSYFDNGIAAVKKDGKAYFINEKNEKACALEYEDAANVHDNKAWVKQDGKWKLIKFNFPLQKEKEKEPEEEKPEVKEESWRETYRDFILEGNLVESEHIWEEKNPTITFVDINNDEIPELLYYDGMTPGPRGIQFYTAYCIKDDQVEIYGEEGELCVQDIETVFSQIGYNKTTKEYIFATDTYAIAADESVVYVAGKDGITTNLLPINEKYDFEKDGYKMKDIKIKSTELLHSYTDKQKNKAIDEAADNYLTNKELYK